MVLRTELRIFYALFNIFTVRYLPSFSRFSPENILHSSGWPKTCFVAKMIFLHPQPKCKKGFYLHATHPPPVSFPMCYISKNHLKVCFTMHTLQLCTQQYSQSQKVPPPHKYSGLNHVFSKQNPDSYFHWLWSSLTASFNFVFSHMEFLFLLPSPSNHISNFFSSPP